MRNNHLQVELFSERNARLIFITLAAAERLLLSNAARVKIRTGKRLYSIMLNPPPPPPSDSPCSPTTITLDDMLANVGLTLRCGGYVTRARREAAQDKIAVFFEEPSYADRLA